MFCSLNTFLLASAACLPGSPVHHLDLIANQLRERERERGARSVITEIEYLGDGPMSEDDDYGDKLGGGDEFLDEDLGF